MSDIEKDKIEKDFLDQLNIWKQLVHDEEEIYRKWAKDNWKRGTDINPLWHPVVRDEWKKLDERNKLLKE